MTPLSRETKLGPIGEAFIAGRLRAQSRRLRELEANKVTAGPPDPLANLERREQARVARHMGSVLRRLQRQGKLSDRQLQALETWASDYAAASAGVRSQLGRDGPAGGGESDVDPARARALALSRFATARTALYVGAGLAAGRITEAVTCYNASLSAAVGAAGKRPGRATAEAGEMLRAGADTLVLHYTGKGGC